MNTNIENTKIKESDVNWDDLEGIGISKAELESNGDLERLMSTGQTLKASASAKRNWSATAIWSGS